mmetsp:Transcript_8008/g.22861  ORF Transcript_8008/g.22861 Transcript_8008/m.22861 type:complete len:246 (-) Transcript_8008:681-1418(-)
MGVSWPRWSTCHCTSMPMRAEFVKMRRPMNNSKFALSTNFCQNPTVIVVVRCRAFNSSWQALFMANSRANRSSSLIIAEAEVVSLIGKLTLECCITYSRERACGMKSLASTFCGECLLAMGAPSAAAISPPLRSVTVAGILSSLWALRSLELKSSGKGPMLVDSGGLLAMPAPSIAATIPLLSSAGAARLSGKSQLLLKSGGLVPPHSLGISPSPKHGVNPRFQGDATEPSMSCEANSSSKSRSA